MNRKILILRIFLRKMTILNSKKNSKNKTNFKNKNLCEYRPRSRANFHTRWGLHMSWVCLNDELDPDLDLVSRAYIHQDS